MLIIDMPKKYLTDASGFVSCAMCKKYLPLLYRDCNNDFKGCLIKGEIPEQHGDLIDRDEALYDIKRLICNGCNWCETEDDCAACITNGIEDILCHIKPIIAAERKDDEQIH